MNKFLLIIFGIICLFLFTSEISAQQFVYRPINPSFGGDAYNGSWLLAQAQAQNNISETSQAASSYNRNPLDDFKDNLNRQILSQISRQLVSTSFGENALSKGHYELGDYVIDVLPSDQGVNISILEASTGNETTVIVPYF